jgi:chromosome segregation ATPase
MATRTPNKLLPLALVVAGLMTVHPCAGATASTELSTIELVQKKLTAAVTQLAKVKMQVTNETHKVEDLAKDLRDGRDAAEVARELRQTQQRVNQVEQQVVEISRSTRFIRSALMKFLDRARLRGDDALQKAVERELARLDNLVQTITVVKQDIDSLEASIARLWDELRSIR